MIVIHVSRFGGAYKDSIRYIKLTKTVGDFHIPQHASPEQRDLAAVLARKIELLMAHFGSQRSKQWFDDETFRGLARIRGMECRAPERYAEAFFARKVSLT